MMKGFSHYWTKRQIKKQLAAVREEIPPTMVIQNVTYLNSMRRSWIKANIWVYYDRIIYIGEEMPSDTSGTTIVPAEGKFAVPGYIEHHAHPFQLYNPLTLAKFAAERGTTTLIGDNLPFMLHLPREKISSLLEELQRTPASLLWFARFDPQTELQNGADIFSYANIRAWLNHPYVVQGGELTDWPRVLNGDEQMLHSMLETKDLRKPIEGHLPGAGGRTLTQMALLGVNGDHESMTAEDVFARLDAGLTASLRYSSIRPDLPELLRGLHNEGLHSYDSLLMTTDGSPPHFMKDGMMEHLIQIALDEGVPFIDAVHMVTWNVSRHFYMDDVLGILAPGRIANINLLESRENPMPCDVLAKGKWVRKNHEPCFPEKEIDWASFGLEELDLSWDLKESDFHFSMPLGMEMVNEVIMKPYQTKQNQAADELPEDSDENFMVLLDRNGRWNVSTFVKGFANNIHGFASSFSNTGDILLIGKSKQGLREAFYALKENKGGIILMDKEGEVTKIDLPIGGIFSEKTFDEGLVSQEEDMRQALKERGYTFSDPIYSLLFFSATHLPYVRITQKGIVDVKKKRVLFPALMR
ncbi:adenine deaminase C-terminal domain-containing protein [Alkalicoccus saliphilus]|uniref:adenine deaminase n=1 Tax=Alkalicoccus saliphilus TaxID=200989 RepID=A0A2T4U755_9BACI|nr:adenine deaminase C-terminal domain-containing protein [Alkalicoccus saliphilus]PTL39214.1 adenosine deaminase [Alkalicoccus saliphilus]